MTSNEIRQSFLKFFEERGHTIVPSAPVIPHGDKTLLFTNAGMNQFKDVFLGEGSRSYTRAADTQKVIRVSGKHNDLEDVGHDTYHHTFFEMLGNWSFGDYFKKEAIEWAWELVVEKWKFPAKRLYATVYKPGAGDPSEFDQEAYNHWARLFSGAGLDPKVHIVYGDKKDNFWMMGDTGPCGPCSEIHVDLTPAGDTKGRLVNQGDARCFAIADGIQPSNEGRGYVLRRILRRAVRYGRTLGFHEPFFYKLADVLAQTMGEVFPEIRVKKKHVEEVIRAEEEAFNKTLDRGIVLFEECVRLVDPILQLRHAVAPLTAELKEIASAESGPLPVKALDLGREIGQWMHRIDGELFLNVGTTEAEM